VIKVSGRENWGAQIALTAQLDLREVPLINRAAVNALLEILLVLLAKLNALVVPLVRGRQSLVRRHAINAHPIW